MSDVPAPRVVVFDMDETLGHFVQFGGFWDAIERAHGGRLDNDHFVETISLYPEVVRPGMEVLLAQLVAARRNGLVSAIIMYTNNQGPESWAKSIAAYFDHIAGTQVFDMIIPAYMVGNRRVSPCRTGHAKSPEDLLRCTGLPPTTRVCFVDDQMHEPMAADNVYYIRCPPYVSVLLPADMADRYLAHNGRRLDTQFRSRLGRALMGQRYAGGKSSLGAASGDTTGWIRAHIGKFIAETQPEVTRRRPRAKSRRRRGGLTRRRRHALLWL